MNRFTKSCGRWATKLALALGLSLLIPGLALADCGEPTSTRVVYKEKPGFWFGSETTKCLLRDAKRTGLLQSKIELMTDERDRREDHFKRMSRVVEIMKEENETLIDLTNHQSEAIASANAWYRSPLLWVAIGAGAAIGGYFLIK